MVVESSTLVPTARVALLPKLVWHGGVADEGNPGEEGQEPPSYADVGEVAPEDNPADEIQPGREEYEEDRG